MGSAAVNAGQHERWRLHMRNAFEERPNNKQRCVNKDLLAPLRSRSAGCSKYCWHLSGFD
jgi:hypothetical protein